MLIIIIINLYESSQKMSHLNNQFKKKNIKNNLQPKPITE
jgi:ribosome-interacting GTPase 1